MKSVVMKNKGKPLLENVQIADSFFTRFMGLMFKKQLSENSGLHIVPCNQIHMFNMRFPIDVLYLDVNNLIVRIDIDVQPWKICKTERRAHSVVEINSGTAQRLALSVGETLEFETVIN